MTRGSGAALAVAVLLLAAPARSGSDFQVDAVWEPPAGEAIRGAIAVELRPTSDDIHVNEQPAPRLALDPDQRILEYEPPVVPAHTRAADPDEARYLDPEQPVRFPAAVRDSAPAGLHLVRGTITYFYCSKSAGWCRKGTGEIEVGVRVP